MDETTRWYDKDVKIKQLINFLEGIPEEYKKIISHEILQIIFCEININTDEKINSLTKIPQKHKKRWYDKSINIQSCIELLHSLPLEKKHIVVERIIETIHQIIANERF